MSVNIFLRYRILFFFIILLQAIGACTKDDNNLEGKNEMMGRMNVYPNPCNGQFTISITNAEASDMTIELLSTSGKVVLREEVKKVYSYNAQVDGSCFYKGLYYLIVTSKDEVKVEKVIIE